MQSTKFDVTKKVQEEIENIKQGKSKRSIAQLQTILNELSEGYRSCPFPHGSAFSYILSSALTGERLWDIAVKTGKFLNDIEEGVNAAVRDFVSGIVWQSDLKK